MTGVNMGYICILSQMKSKFNLDKWRCSLYIGISIAKKENGYTNSGKKEPLATKKRQKSL